jgi:hypothetical protein
MGLLAKMAVDRTLNSSLQDAREAFINVCVDTVSRYAHNIGTLVVFWDNIFCLSFEIHFWCFFLNFCSSNNVGVL